MQSGTKTGRFEPVQATTLRDRATDAIRSAISRGVLQPGERIRERELAEELGVSRLPIREAIRQLEHEGLLVTVPRRGTFVARVSESDVYEIFSLRAILEDFAIRLVTQGASEEDLLRLQQVVDEMKEASARGDHPVLFELDTRFHTLLCALAGHRRLSQHWRLVDSQWRTLLSLDQERHLVVTMGNYADIHQVLVNAIASRDPDRSGRALREHLETSQKVVIRVMSSTEESSALGAVANAGG